MTSRRTNHVRNPASRDLAIYHEILPPRDQLMSERRCHCLRRAIIRFAAIVSGRLVTIDQPAAASKCAWALRRCVGSFRKRAGASIPIPGGCSLRPVKNRGWGSFKGVCKLAVTRSAVFFLAQNAPQTVWRSGSGRTRRGSLQRSHRRDRPISWTKRAVRPLGRRREEWNAKGGKKEKGNGKNSEKNDKGEAKWKKMERGTLSQISILDLRDRSP